MKMALYNCLSFSYNSSNSRYIYENWNAITGEGGDRSSCDTFYHWGALLGFMALLEP